jgi:hypothetical protein
MSPATVIQKLRLGAGQKALVLNAPQGFLESLGELPEGTTLSGEPGGTFDFVQAFVTSQAELLHLAPVAAQAVKHDGLLWMCYPKLSSKLKGDLSRDTVWKLMKPTGLRPVTQIAIDETWSALRFRPASLVGT